MIRLLLVLSLLVVESTILSLPDDIRSLIIDLGANSDPILPPLDDTSVAVLAVEPLPRHCATIERRNVSRLFLLCAAVGTYDGIGTLRNLGSNGLLSTLAVDTTPGYLDRHTGCADKSTTSIVPVLTLRTVLNAVPRDVSVRMLKTDLQGLDFAVVRSAGESIRRVERILAETSVGRLASYVLPPDVPSNHLVRSWLPYMTAHGFVTRHAIEEVEGIEESDVLWRRTDVSPRKRTTFSDVDTQWKAPRAVSLRIAVKNRECTASDRREASSHCTRDVDFSVEQGEDASKAARAWCARHATRDGFDLCVSKLISAVMFGLNYEPQ